MIPLMGCFRPVGGALCPDQAVPVFGSGHNTKNSMLHLRFLFANYTCAQNGNCLQIPDPLLFCTRFTFHAY